MKSVLVISLILCVLICLVHTVPSNEKRAAPKYALNVLDQHFEDFKKLHGKTYENKTRHDHRYI